MQKIVPHLWYDKEALDAAEFYISLFEHSRVISQITLKNTPSGDADLITIELAGQEFMLISAGPYFHFTPAVSFVVSCNTVDEVERLWNSFLVGGVALMPLASYPFSERYGWIMDRYGLSWQIIFTGDNTVKQKITPTLMFIGDQCGNAEEAIRFYTDVFQSSGIGNILRYGEDAYPNKPGTVQHMDFTLENQGFAAMDSAYDHKFTFNEAVSFVVNCDTQEEIDSYWVRLSAVPKAEQCGWLRDKYGVSWQINPSIMREMLQDKDPKKLAKVTEAFLKMKKFNLEELKKAYEE